MDTSRWEDATRRWARALGARARSSGREAVRGVRSLPRRTARSLLVLAIVDALLLVAIVLVDILVDEPLRASIERWMNANLQGYSVRIGGADLNPWNLSLDLTDLVVRQRAHPDPPVLDLAAFRFTVQWRALLKLKLDAEVSRFRARGAFMGSGRTAIQGAFRPDPGGADFDLAIAIEGTRLAAMNDLLRAYANLDVTEGLFSIDSELRVAGGRVDGYVKPLFHDVEVYDAEQDRERGFFRKLWERIADGLAEILENPPREDVATVADISGPVSSPDASNLQVVLNLIENAFFDSILPGFREEAKGGD